MADGFLGLFRGDPGTKKLAPGQVLFSKGEAAHHLYVIESGKLEILDGDTVLETVGPEDIVGEMALIDGEPRSATVRAVTASVVITVDEKRFLRMVSDTPYFALRVMRVLTHRLRAMDKAIATRL